MDKMISKARVSVMIPTYNYAHCISETIESVLNQSFTDFELQIVDNCSTDNTEAVVSKYLADSRVSYHRHDRNLGVVANFNWCLENAKCEYIKFLCADDKFHPQLLEKYVPIMDKHQNVSLITCDKQAFGMYSHQTITPLTHLIDGRTAILHMLIGKYCWIGEPSSVMFRKRDLTVGLFSYEYVQNTDWEMWMRLLTVGDCYVVPEILVYVRFHNASVSKEQKSKRFVICFEHYKLCKDVQQKKYNIDVRDSGIDEAVRKTAIFCIKHAMLKTIPELHKKECREAFKKAFKIAYDESLFSSSLSELFKGLKRKLTRKISKIQHGTPA